MKTLWKSVRHGGVDDDDEDVEHHHHQVSLLSLKAYPHDVISYTQALSNSLIRKLSLWLQHNSTKESYDTNRIIGVCWP